ncbi:hypothetical protein C8J56DRAFT_1049991 [Mycena floridula]|nr:hypothetical protein C8J56DRAFT_1049991 [Mycena floridula]
MSHIIVRVSRRSLQKLLVVLGRIRISTDTVWYPENHDAESISLAPEEELQAGPIVFLGPSNLAGGPTVFDLDFMLVNSTGGDGFSIHMENKAPESGQPAGPPRPLVAVVLPTFRWFVVRSWSRYFLRMVSSTAFCAQDFSKLNDIREAIRPWIKVYNSQWEHYDTYEEAKERYLSLAARQYELCIYYPSGSLRALVGIEKFPLEPSPDFD